MRGSAVACCDLDVAERHTSVERCHDERGAQHVRVDRSESGASSETAGVGNEGVVGIALFMGGGTTPSSAVVQTAGHGYRLE